MTGNDSDDEPLPRALEVLWREPTGARRPRGLSRERIVEAAVDLADADGLGALSMARLAERLGCGTMSLYRHVTNKDGRAGDVHAVGRGRTAARVIG